MRIMGIDPGSRITGFGIIDWHKRQARYVTSGCIRVDATQSLDKRLAEIIIGINTLLAQYQPQQFAIEKVFMHKNPDAALKLGQARGVAIVAAAQQAIPVYEYSPNEIKKTVVGHGHAEKQQMQHMVKVLLKLSAVPQVDAADALGVALCHAYHN